MRILSPNPRRSSPHHTGRALFTAVGWETEQLLLRLGRRWWLAAFIYQVVPCRPSLSHLVDFQPISSKKREFVILVGNRKCILNSMKCVLIFPQRVSEHTPIGISQTTGGVEEGAMSDARLRNGCSTSANTQQLCTRVFTANLRPRRTTLD